MVGSVVVHFFLSVMVVFGFPVFIFVIKKSKLKSIAECTVLLDSVKGKYLKIIQRRCTLATVPQKEPEKPEDLIAELKAWADAEYGRRAELARMLGVSRQLISEWFADPPRSVPTWDHGLKIEAFLKKTRRAKSRARSL
jgi:hypothetical protein